MSHYAPLFFFSSFLHFLINRLGKDPCFATQKNTDKSVEIPKSQTIEFKPQAEQTLNDRKKAEADLWFLIYSSNKYKRTGDKALFP